MAFMVKHSREGNPSHVSLSETLGAICLDHKNKMENGKQAKTEIVSSHMERQTQAEAELMTVNRKFIS